MTIVLVIIAFGLTIALLKGLYYLIIYYLFSESPRADEIHTVITDDGWRLRLCRYRPRGGRGEPVLMVHGATGNQWNFALPEGNAPVDVLRERGYDCWLIDLRGDRSSQPPLGQSRFDACFDDYILRDIPAALDLIRNTTGYEKVHWVGHSMGGLIFYAYELVHGRDAIASATTMGTPPGFSNVTVGWIQRLVPIARRAPGLAEIALRGFAPWVPLLKLNGSPPITNWRNVDEHVGAAAFYNLMELLPPRVIEDLLGYIHTDTWMVKGGNIDVLAGLKSLKTPLFVVHGVLDPLCPAENRERFFDNLQSDDKQMLILGREYGHCDDYNHVDMVFARRGREEVYGPIADWLDAHPIGERAPADRPVQRTLDAASPDASWRRALRRAADVMSGMAEHGPSRGAVSPAPRAASGPVPAHRAVVSPEQKAAAKRAAGAALKTKAKSSSKKSASKRSSQKSPSPGVTLKKTSPTKKAAAKKATIKKAAAPRDKKRGKKQ